MLLFWTISNSYKDAEKLKSSSIYSIKTYDTPKNPLNSDLQSSETVF